MDEARHLAMNVARVVEEETRADLMEVQLASTLEGQHKVSTIERRPGRYKSKPLATRKVPGSFGAADEVHLQGYNFGFNVSKFIIWEHYLLIGEATRLLIPHNAILEENVSSIRQRQERLRKSLKLADIVLLSSPPKK